MQQREQGTPPDLARALDGLAARRPDLRWTFTWVDAVPSTMEVVNAAGDSGAPAGRVVMAGEQTAGRGRRGHAWSSPPGAGLYLSYLARPTRDLSLVTLAAGVAVRAGLARATGLAADLKWPNDLLVGGRKIAGLLAEGARLNTPESFVTIGVGLNLRQAAYPSDVAGRATWVEREIGHAVDRGPVLAAVLESLIDALAALDAGDAGAILREWRAASPSAIGTTIEWTGPSGVRRGTTAGIDDTGALLVRTPSGLERLISGDLRWPSGV